MEGSNDTGSALTLGTSWTLLYSGDTGLVPFSVTRLAWGDIQNFTNTIAFTAYRMIITSQRGIDYCVQFAEMNLYGYLWLMIKFTLLIKFHINHTFFFRWRSYKYMIDVISFINFSNINKVDIISHQRRLIQNRKFQWIIQLVLFYW